MKKFRVLNGVVLLSSMLLLLTACSGGETKKAADKKPDTAQNFKVELSIDGGEYIIPDGETVDDETGFLALNIKLKNKSDEKLEISSADFSLYGEDGEKVSSEHVYDSKGNFKVMSSESLSEDKSFTEPLVFEVDKDAKYELHYKPTYYSEDEKDEGVELKLDTKKYTDKTKAVEELVSQYVTTVFYDSDDKEETKLKLSNDLTQERKAFKEDGINLLKKGFTNYDASNEEVGKIITQIQASNREKAQVTYRFKEFFPETAAIYVRPEVVLLRKADKDAIVKQFVDENKGKYSDYASAQRDAEKYLIQELPTRIKEVAIDTPADMNGEGYRIDLEKKDGKWEINSANESQNYTFKSLKSSFRGGLNE